RARVRSRFQYADVGVDVSVDVVVHVDLLVHVHVLVDVDVISFFVWLLPNSIPRRCALGSSL
ncbi:MAG: hypothetical protein ACR2L2_12770, partial [Acidobacteriota bacterium]